MNIALKSAIAGALALASSGAFAIGVPATDSSDLVLVIQNTTTPANVYILDTGISLDSVLPSASLSPNGSTVSGSTAIAGLNQSIAASSLLQSFLAANPASGDGWELEGSQFTGGASSAPTNANSKNVGTAKGIFSSTNTQSNILGAAFVNFKQFVGGVQADITAPTDSLGLSPLLQPGVTEATTGASFNDGGAGTKYGLFGATDLASLGSTSSVLYGFTGNGDTTSVQSYILGSATLSTNGTLAFSPNAGGGTGTPPAVPLPAAVWLFGSGLLGFVGVSRRRKPAVAA